MLRSSVMLCISTDRQTPGRRYNRRMDWAVNSTVRPIISELFDAGDLASGVANNDNNLVNQMIK